MLKETNVNIYFNLSFTLMRSIVKSASPHKYTLHLSTVDLTRKK